jgi:hypothetical protein
MIPPSNYRISVKKNISLKTINHFHHNKNTIDNQKLAPSEVYKHNQDKKSFQNLATQKSIMVGQKTLDMTFSFDSSDHFIKRYLFVITEKNTAS